MQPELTVSRVTMDARPAQLVNTVLLGPQVVPPVLPANNALTLLPPPYVVKAITVEARLKSAPNVN